MLNQTARSNWQLMEEKNTKFFHRAIMKRRKRNTILRLHVRNVWKTDQSSIKDAFYSHYSSFLGKMSTPKVFLLNSGLLMALEEQDKKSLVQAFNMSEIEDALFSTNSAKAPGPDGLNARVLKSIWKHIQNDILLFFNNFFETSYLP